MHKLLTVHHLINATNDLFSLAFTQYNLCYHIIIIIIIIFMIIYDSTCIRVRTVFHMFHHVSLRLVMNNSLKSRGKQETRLLSLVNVTL